MIKIGKNFEESIGGNLTLPKLKCSLCCNNYYFLKCVNTKKGNEQYCNFCQAILVNEERASNGGSVHSSRINSSDSDSDSDSSSIPPRSPPLRVSLISGLIGVMLMIIGFVFTFFNMESDGANLMRFVFGSATSLAGFILFRRFMLINGLPKQIRR